MKNQSRVADFSLLDFIKNEQDITKENAPQIVGALLIPNLFKGGEISFVSNWLYELPFYQKEVLFANTSLYNALNLNDGRIYYYPRNDSLVETEELALWIYRFIEAKMPPSIAKWVTMNFKFPRIMLPSRAYLYVERDEFFEFLEQSVKDYPHIIDELKLLKKQMKDGVNIVPDNGYFLRSNACGTTILKTRSIQFYHDILNEVSLETVLHELGHLERLNFVQKFNRSFMPLIQYIDEAEQFAKSFLTDSLVRRDYFARSLVDKIRQDVQEVYPMFKPMTVERLTAYQAKNLFSAMILMDKKNREKVMMSFVHKGYLSAKESENFLKEFCDIYDYYPKRYSFFNSAFYQKELLKRLFFKRYKTPPLLQEVLGEKMATEMVLSDAFLTELNQKSGFVDVERDDVSKLALDCLFLGETQVALCLTGKTKKQVQAILDFYESYEVYFKKESMGIYLTKEVEMSDKVKCMVLSDFYRAPIKKVARYIKIDKSLIADEKLLKDFVQSIAQKKRNSAPFFETKSAIVVQENILKETPFEHLLLEAKTFLGCELDYITSQSYLTEIYTRFNARHLPLKTVINDEIKGKKSLCIFQKNVTEDEIQSYLKLQQEAKTVCEFVACFNGAENTPFVQNIDAKKQTAHWMKNKNKKER